MSVYIHTHTHAAFEGGKTSKDRIDKYYVWDVWDVGERERERKNIFIILYNKYMNDHEWTNERTNELMSK